MEFTENMTFEEATDALAKELKEQLDALRQRFDVQPAEWKKLQGQLTKAITGDSDKPTFHPEVVEVRPRELECDVVRFQNNKEKWVALVGLLNGHPYEIFTGLQDDEEGIMLPKSVTKGKIVKTVLGEGAKRYDFQFVNKRGYKITVEGLSEKFNPEYWNYAKLISGVLRYRMPIKHVIKLVSQLQLTSDNINTWKVGVERALKNYLSDDEKESINMKEADIVKEVDNVKEAGNETE